MTWKYSNRLFFLFRISPRVNFFLFRIQNGSPWITDSLLKIFKLNRIRLIINPISWLLFFFYFENQISRLSFLMYLFYNFDVLTFLSIVLITTINRNSSNFIWFNFPGPFIHSFIKAMIIIFGSHFEEQSLFCLRISPAYRYTTFIGYHFSVFILEPFLTYKQNHAGLVDDYILRIYCCYLNIYIIDWRH